MIPGWPNGVGVAISAGASVALTLPDGELTPLGMVGIVMLLAADMPDGVAPKLNPDGRDGLEEAVEKEEKML